MTSIMAKAIEDLKKKHMQERRDLVTRMICEMAIGSKTTQICYGYRNLFNDVPAYLRDRGIPHKAGNRNEFIDLQNRSELIFVHPTEPARYRGVSANRVILTCTLICDEWEYFRRVVGATDGELIAVEHPV
jgi:hypothetical protein